ncbi:MAG TPA: class I SAM-dependent methyltransferase [Solirubrobacteraceae bacterium]|nr:class I SAM-dependent methyltransferase [Solirubrobacteraceae bacterium]
MADHRSYGAVFDTVAVQYDRHRPRYPDDLIDHACRAAGLAAGDRVLEIGCGTGQLTRNLVARGLRVTAVDPGANLIKLAAARLDGTGDVEFVHSRFEDASPGGGFAAVFSASAFHWIDPDVSWGRVAQSLEPGGLLALIQYAAVRDERTETDDDALLDALARAAPAIAASWPALRELDAFLSGVEDRRENVSEVWAWVGEQPLARPCASALFVDVEVAVVPVVSEQTAAELNALLRTISLYHRLPPDERQALHTANQEIEERLGRPIRASMLGVLVTARRA